MGRSVFRFMRRRGWRKRESRPIGFRMYPCTTFNKASFKKAKEENPQCCEAEDNPRAMDALLLKLLTEMSFVPWSRDCLQIGVCGCHVKSICP